MKPAWFALALCVACTDAEPAWEGAIETLPNGATRVVNRGEGAWRDGSAWRLEPVLAIGEVDGSDATTFASISALEIGDDGRIYVLDRQANELRIFDPAGVHLRTTGRAGAGPGEYQGANGLVWLAPDTLVIIDQRGARYSVLNRDGDFVRSVSRSLPFYAWTFQGGLFQGRVYEQDHIGADDDTRPVFVGTTLTAEPAALDTVPLPRTTAPNPLPFSVRTERGGRVMSVPFAPASHFRLDRSGDIWHAHGSEYRIFRSRVSGDTVIEITRETRPVAVTDAEIDEWANGEGPKGFREMGGIIDLGRIPRNKPYFNDLFVDDDGFLWVAVIAPSRSAAFDIFDADGHYLGRLEVPGIRRDGYITPVIRNGRLHMVGRDELDVQRVLVFRVDGRRARSPAERRM